MLELVLGPIIRVNNFGNKSKRDKSWRSLLAACSLDDDEELGKNPDDDDQPTTNTKSSK